MKASKYTVSLMNGVVQGVAAMATIHLYDDDSKEAMLVFYDPAKTPTVPPNKSEPKIIRYLPKDHYPWHLDLLRHESPITLVDGGGFSIGNGTLTTGSKELVGESE